MNEITMRKDGEEVLLASNRRRKAKDQHTKKRNAKGEKTSLSETTKNVDVISWSNPNKVNGHPDATASHPMTTTTIAIVEGNTVKMKVRRLRPEVTWPERKT